MTLATIVGRFIDAQGNAVVGDINCRMVSPVQGVGEEIMLSSNIVYTLVNGSFTLVLAPAIYTLLVVPTRTLFTFVVPVSEATFNIMSLIDLPSNASFNFPITPATGGGLEGNGPPTTTPLTEPQYYIDLLDGRIYWYYDGAWH